MHVAENDKAPPYPGMMGDGTEEQNLDQIGNPKAGIDKDEVEAAFGEKKTTAEADTLPSDSEPPTK